MARILAIIIAALLAAVSLLWLTWYLAYGMIAGPPASVAIEDLQGEAGIYWAENGSVHIHAATSEDALAALGYAQGLRHGWQLALWRQSAEGRLAEWFGEPVLDHDALSRMLRLGEGARSAYASLGDEDRAMLAAFSRGVNAAFEHRAVRQSDEFVVFDVVPEPWEPWHSIAVERLVAWLATPNDLVGVAPGDHVERSPATRASSGQPHLDYESARFAESRQAFRKWLHLYGFEHGAVIGLADGDGTLIHRQVYGATIQPLFQEAELHVGGAVMQGAALIGTPFFPVGRMGDAAWAIILHSDAALEPLPAGSHFPGLSFDRIELAVGTEAIVTFRLDDNHLVLAQPRYTVPQFDEPPPRQLTWDGLRGHTDASAWFNLMRGDAPGTFRLFSGTGVVAAAGDPFRPTGPTRYHAITRDGIVVSPDETAAKEISQWIQNNDAAELPAETIANDVYSSWAASLAVPLVEGLDTTYTHRRSVEEAMMYLRNWNHAFDAASIGASIFDAWYHELQKLPPVAPEAALMVPDTTGPSLHPEVSRNYRALLAALERLERDYGADKSRWRWEEVQPNEHYYPVFSDSSLAATAGRRLNQTRYAPLSLSGSGHPTTVRFGPSTDPNEPPAPSVWIGWMQHRAGEPLHYIAVQNWRRRFLSRYLIEGRGMEPRAVGPVGDAVHATTLTPAER